MILTTLALSATLLIARQDKPTEIPKAELPKEAECHICSSSGEGHGPEKPAAGVKYKGKTYFFCSKKEFAAFRADPEFYAIPDLPRPAPKVAGTTLEGKAFEPETYQGKIVLVDFWATWCAPCLDAMPKMNRLQADYGAKGFTVLGVSIDEETKKVAPMAAKKKLAYPVVLDDPKNPTWYSFKAASVPAIYLINREGQIIAQWRGKIDHKAVEEAVKAAVGS